MHASATNRLRGRLRLPLLTGRMLALAQLDAADLSRERLREVLHELDLPRIRVLGQPVTNEAADLAGQVVAGLMPFREHDERLHDVSAPLVGRRHRRGLAYRRMLDAGGLDLEWADSVAGRDDHVVRPSGVPDVAVLIHHGGVLRVEPLTAERLARRLLVVPVAERVVRV